MFRALQGQPGITEEEEVLDTVIENQATKGTHDRTMESNMREGFTRRVKLEWEVGDEEERGDRGDGHSSHDNDPT